MPRYRTNAELTDMLAEEMGITQGLREELMSVGRQLDERDERIRELLEERCRLLRQLHAAQRANGRLRTATRPVQARLVGVWS